MNESIMAPYQDFLPIILLYAFIIFLFFYFNKITRRKMKKILEKQALKRNGKLTKGSLFNYPRLTLSHNRTEILIYSTPGGKNTPPYTYIQCELNSVRVYRIKLCREYRLFGIGTVFG